MNPQENIEINGVKYEKKKRGRPCINGKRMTNAEYQKRYREKNKEKVRAYGREYYYKNRERMNKRRCELAKKKAVKV